MATKGINKLFRNRTDLEIMEDPICWPNYLTLTVVNNAGEIGWLYSNDYGSYDEVYSFVMKKNGNDAPTMIEYESIEEISSDWKVVRDAS